MSEDVQRDLGAHDAQIKRLEDDVNEIRSDVKEIKETLLQAKGGWKTLLMVAGAAGAMGAFLAKLAAILGISAPPPQ